MGEYATHEGPSRGRESMLATRVIEHILPVLILDAKVEVRAVAGLLGKGLGRQRGDETMLERNRADGLAQLEMIVGSDECPRVVDRDFVLAMPQFRIVLLNRKRLGLQCRHQVIHE